MFMSASENVGYCGWQPWMFVAPCWSPAPGVGGMLVPRCWMLGVGARVAGIGASLTLVLGAVRCFWWVLEYIAARVMGVCHEQCHGG